MVQIPVPPGSLRWSSPIDPGGGGRGLLRQMNGLTRHRLAENAGLDFSRFSGRQVQAGSARQKGETGFRSFRAAASGKRYAASPITALPNAPDRRTTTGTLTACWRKL